MKKSLLIILALLTAAASGCSSAEKPQETEASSVSETVAEVTEETTSGAVNSAEYLGAYDFGGAEYNILGREYAKLGSLPSIEFDVESENGDIINDTVYNRNRTVEENFNAVIKGHTVPQGQGITAVQKSVSAGDGAYNLVFAHTGEMSNMALNKLLYNFNDLPEVDITQPWWNRLATENLTLNGRCYLQINYIPFTGMMLSHCLYFNKALAEDNGIDGLYGMAEDNSWTFDEFSAMAKSVSSDLDGNGTYDKNDRFGLLCSHGTSGVAFSVGMDVKPIRIAEDGSFTLTMAEDRVQSVLEKIVSLTRDDAVYMITDYSLENDLAKMFAAGQGLFYSGFLTDSYMFFRDMDDDFGLLPFPKYDETQDGYITTLTGGTGLLGVPADIKDPELTGVVTEALAIESLKSVYPALYETVFDNKLMRDDESLKMFDILMNGMELHFGRTYKYGNYTDVIDSLVMAGSTDLMSRLTVAESSAKAYYEEVIAVFFE